MASVSSVTSGVELSQNQTLLLAELTECLGAGGETSQQGAQEVLGTCPGSTDYEAFCSHWYRVEAKRHQDVNTDANWAWLQQLYSICGETVAEFEASLAQLEQLERQRHVVAAKTAHLHQQCEVHVAEVEKQGAKAEGISQRLGVFQTATELSRLIDEEPPTSIAEYTSFLDRIEDAVACLEAHYDFSEAPDCFSRFEALRNRACIMVRAAFQKSLKRAEAHVEQVFWFESENSVDTQVFYTPFHAAAQLHKPFMGCLHHRMRMHRLYATTLEELEHAFCNLRLRLVGDATREHLKTLVGSKSKESQLASLVRDAAEYVLEAAQREQQLFASFFEVRQPQDALQALLQQLGRVFYDVLHPVVVENTVLDALHEAAESLYTEILEPHQEDVERAGIPAAALSFLVRLHGDLRWRLLARARVHVETYVHRYQIREADLDYPDVLFPSAAYQSEARLRGARFPTLEQTLAVLAKTYRALPAEQFETLASEAVAACVGSLREASRRLAQRPLPEVPDGVAPVVRAMDARLFLIRHLLILREQTAGLESTGAVASLGASHEIVGSPKSQSPEAGGGGSMRKSQDKRNGLIDAELTSTCGELLEALSSWVARPLLLLRARGALGGQAEAQATAEECFLSNLRTWLPRIVAHFRAFLGEPGSVGSGGAAEVLQQPLRTRLLEAASASKGSSSEQELEPLLDKLFAEAAGMSWSQLREAVLSAPRIRPSLPVAPTAAPLDAIRSIDIGVPMGHATVVNGNLDERVAQAVAAPLTS